MTGLPRVLPPSPWALSAVDQLVWPALPDAVGQQALALQSQLQIAEWWSPHALAQAQLSQLDALVRHAAAHVPYYAKRMRRWKLDPTVPLTWEAFRQIPVLTREEVQRAGETLYATSTPPTHGRVGVTSTSGSSGRPVTLRKTELTLALWRAVTLRDHLWHRRDLSAKSCHIREVGGYRADPPHGADAPTWGAATDHIFHTGPAATLSITADIESQARWIERHKPRYLLCYPSALRGLLDHWERTKRPPRGLHQVRTISEMLRPGLRERVQEILGAHLVDLYSSQEVGYLALQCPDHPHYHVQSETVHVEVLRDDDTPCAPGEAGRVVVTPLHHFATPLLRYEIGDGAEVGEPCPCGRGLPVLTQILGRMRHMLHFPDGRRVWPTFGVVGFARLAPIRQWRIVQTAIDHLEFHLTTARPLTGEEERALVEHVLSRLGHPFRVTIVPRPEGIPSGANGKYEDFICAIDPNA